jgi:amicoumacin kinase
MKQREQDLILSQLAHCYGIEPTQLHCLTDNPEDGVYGFTQHGQDFVVKYTLPTVRSFSNLQGQVDWLNFLATHGAPVSRPISSINGEMVEQLPINESLVSVICYEHAPGERPQNSTWTAEFFQRWGQVMGKLHALSTHYTPPQQHRRINHWHESASYDRQTIPAEQSRVLEKFDALQHYLHVLPKDRHAYGVIHGDFQANNLLVDKGLLRVIDFDNCEYNWFVMDIATSLYFTLWERPAEQSNAAFASFVLENMLVGYAREHSLGPEWVEQIPHFLKVVEMNIYIAIHEHNQAVLQSHPEAVPPKHRALLSRYRYQIEQDVPYLESACNPWASD